MKASCPPTWTSPSRLIRRRSSSDLDTGASTITLNPGKRPARYGAATRPDSPSLVSNTTLALGMENLVGDRRHRHRAHAIAVLQDTKMIEDFAKERQIFL